MSIDATPALTKLIADAIREKAKSPILTIPGYAFVSALSGRNVRRQMTRRESCAAVIEINDSGMVLGFDRHVVFSKCRASGDDGRVEFYTDKGVRLFSVGVQNKVVLKGTGVTIGKS